MLSHDSDEERQDYFSGKQLASTHTFKKSYELAGKTEADMKKVSLLTKKHRETSKPANKRVWRNSIRVSNMDDSDFLFPSLK